MGTGRKQVFWLISGLALGVVSVWFVKNQRTTIAVSIDAGNILTQKKEQVLRVMQGTQQNRSIVVEKNLSLSALSVKFRRVSEIKQKPFPSQEDLLQLEESLSSADLLLKAFSLLDSKDGFFSVAKDGTSFEAPRLEAIQYLAHSVSWRDNPMRSEILSRLGEFALRSPPEGLPSENNKSWLGDKIETYSILLQSDPVYAKSLLSRVRGTELEQIFKYSIQFTKRLRARNP